LAGLRGMIIDSNKDNSDTIARLIKAIGHIPVIAENQEHALDLVSTDTFDYFVLNPILPLMEMEEDTADFENGLGLIEQIRDYYPKAIHYPIIAYSESLFDDDKKDACMEVSVNKCLSFKSNTPGDKTILSRNIRKLTDKALAKRNNNASRPEHNPAINIEYIHKKISSKYKLVIDLKAMAVFFNKVEVPSGKDGLQQRHKVFLFILAKNIGKAMSFDDIQKEINKYSLDRSDDPPRNIRSQIRSTLRKLAKKHPGKIAQDEIKTLIKTVRHDHSLLNIDKEDVFTIYGKEVYP